MLATNIEGEVKAIIEKKGNNGWLRTSECAKIYAEGNASKETKFYRWRKQVEKEKVKGFQVIGLLGNISFIGLKSANPLILESLMSTDKPSIKQKASRFGFFELLNDVGKRRRLKEIMEEIEEAEKVLAEAKKYGYDFIVTYKEIELKSLREEKEWLEK